MIVAPAIEKRLLQGVVALACLVPLIAGSTGIWKGAAWLEHGPVAADLDSHFRYMSGIFLGIGIAFATCVPAIESKGARLRMLAGFVVLGGLARLCSVAQFGWPGVGHEFGLVMELFVTPSLTLWQMGLGRRINSANSGT